MDEFVLLLQLVGEEVNHEIANAFLEKRRGMKAENDGQSLLE